MRSSFPVLNLSLVEGTGSSLIRSRLPRTELTVFFLRFGSPQTLKFMSCGCENDCRVVGCFLKALIARHGSSYQAASI